LLGGQGRASLSFPSGVAGIPRREQWASTPRNSKGGWRCALSKRRREPGLLKRVENPMRNPVVFGSGHLLGVGFLAKLRCICSDLKTWGATLLFLQQAACCVFFARLRRAAVVVACKSQPTYMHPAPRPPPPPRCRLPQAGCAARSGRGRPSGSKEPRLTAEHSRRLVSKNVWQSLCSSSAFLFLTLGLGSSLAFFALVSGFGLWLPLFCS
jgi:hypothetical protein